MNKKPSALDFESYKAGFQTLKKRLFFVIIAIVVFRIGSLIPIPGIDITIISQLLEKQRGTILEMFNIFSGGALSHASIFSLGIMPYISASIIIQLLTVFYSGLSELKKEGETGRCKINQYIRYCTLLLALIQATGISFGLSHMPAMKRLILFPGLLFYVMSITSLVSGTMLLMWLGEKITDYGIGNGISLIIYIGIVAGLPSAIGRTIENFRLGQLHFYQFFVTIIMVVIITILAVFVERGQRKIKVHYAVRQPRRRMNIIALQHHTTHLPLKVNMAGVIPAIFSSSIILFPATLAAWFGVGLGWKWLITLSDIFQPGKLLYIIIYIISIIFFSFFYTSLVFNSRETADNLKKSGAFLQGIRPGEQTAKYINKIMKRLTFMGSLYIIILCLLPEIIRVFLRIPFHFGGTSLLIVVVVIMDFISQIQTIMMSKQYESILKKTKIKNYEY
ncbi:MAG: preprotein translocase subunit SecY [Candidatus Dasytiphilus stammeri]